MRVRGIRKTVPAAVTTLAFAASIVAAPSAQAVAGGTPSYDAQYLAQIFYKGELACSGALLDAKHIVTSLRCLEDGYTWRDVRDFTIRVGDHRLGQGEEVEACGPLLRSIGRPGADLQNRADWQYSDIAVLPLTQNVKSATYFAEPSAELPKVGEDVTLKGWGHGGDLKEAAVQVKTVNDVIPGGDGLTEGMQLKDVTGHAQRRDVGAPVMSGGKLVGVVATPTMAVEVQPYVRFLRSALEFSHAGCKPAGNGSKATGAMTTTS